MRYTHRPTTAALIVAAGLGMGVCSAHPGAVAITNNGGYNITEVDEAVDQIATMTGGQSSIGVYQVRTGLINEPRFAIVADSVGTSMTDEQVDQAIEQIATQTGAQVSVIGRGTRATVRSLPLSQQLNQVAQVNPGAVSAMGGAFEQVHVATNAQINPYFSQPTLDGGQAPTIPLFGNTVSGAKDNPTTAFLSGSVQ